MTKGKDTKAKEVVSKVPTKGKEAKKPAAAAPVEKKPEPAPVKDEETKLVDENEHRESGNTAFKLGQFKKAIKYYTECIEIILEKNLKSSQPDPESNEFIKLVKGNECLLKAYNNRTQCYINIEKWQYAVDDATKVLHACPSETKALYRRSQAYQNINKYAEALQDAKLLMNLESTNKTFIEYIQKLNRTIQDKAQEQQSTKSQTKKMLDLTNDPKIETKVLAFNNLIVLAREDSGSNTIIASGGLPIIVENLQKEKNKEVLLGITRLIASLCKDSMKRSKTVFNQVQYELIAELISYDDQEISTAGALIIQNMILSLTDLENKKTHQRRKVHNPVEFSPEIQEYVDEIFRAIIMLIMEPKCSGYGRDNCIDLCLKYVDRANGCGWTPRFIVFGIPKLLRVAATIPDLNLPGSLPITENTRMHVACCLSAIYDDVYNDSEREKYQETCETFVNDFIKSEIDPNGKIRGIAALGVILQGPFEVGSAIIVKGNLINMMLDLADSDNLIQERVAVEAVVYSASKKDKATGILSEGIDVLKKLYQSKNQQIKVRALVGLCKLASCKGSDVSIKLLADGSAAKLEKACRKILCSAPDYDSKKWACDGLAYLTLDADIKTALANDPASLSVLLELTNKEDKNTFFSIATVLSNVTNAIPPKKPSEEMLKIAEYAKHHIPEVHKYDSEKYIKERRHQLMDAGVANAMSAMAKHKSSNCRELLAGVYLVLAEEVENRGKLVAAGGGKALIPLALEGSEVGKTKASQALAKIAISINPELAFPGQRSLELIRPLIRNLHPDKSELEHYEALMALTNMASGDSSVRKRIIKEQGISNIEQYMFCEDDDLRRAGTECICNLVKDEDCLFIYEKPDNDRVKLLVLYCGEDDLGLNIAASGALAQLTNSSDKICERIAGLTAFATTFKQAACAANIEVQYRIFYIIRNIAVTSKELCTKIVESDLTEVIVALTRIDVEKDRAKVKEIATEIVKLFLEHELIKPTYAGLEGIMKDDTALKEDA